MPSQNKLTNDLNSEKIEPFLMKSVIKLHVRQYTFHIHLL